MPNYKTISLTGTETNIDVSKNNSPKIDNYFGEYFLNLDKDDIIAILELFKKEYKNEFFQFGSGTSVSMSIIIDEIEQRIQSINDNEFKK